MHDVHMTLEDHGRNIKGRGLGDSGVNLPPGPRDQGILQFSTAQGLERLVD